MQQAQPGPVRPPLRFQFATLADVWRVTILRDSILLEDRGVVGGFRPNAQIFWDEVTGVYSWRGPNWNLFAIGLLLGFMGAVAALILIRTNGVIWLGSGVAAVALFSVLAFVVRPYQWYRVDTADGSVLFQTYKREVMPLLHEYLNARPPSSSLPPVTSL